MPADGNQVATVEKAEGAVAVQGVDPIMSLIERAATDPSFDVAKMEKLLEMRERQQTLDAERTFNAQLSKMAPFLPVISKDAEAHNSIKYARLEDIQAAIRPVLQDHGFAIRFKVHDKENALAVECILSHEAGHSDSNQITLPFDASGSKNAVQARGSAVTYGKRYTLCNILNIQVGGEDDDGNSAGKRIPRADVAPLDNKGLSNKEIRQLYSTLEQGILACSSAHEMAQWETAWKDDFDRLDEDSWQSLKGVFDRHRESLKAVEA